MKNNLLIEFEKFRIYEDEKFKFINYPDVNKYKYVVSNYGRVFNFVKMKEKKIHYDKDGYARTSLVFDSGKKNRNVGIHRIVAYTFLKKHPKGYNLVNHLDGKKLNNYYKNLEWTTPKGNTRHAIKIGLQINSGPNCPSAIYDENTIRQICKYLEDGLDVSETYKKFKDDEKISDRAFYALIFSIKCGKRHKKISSEYNIPLTVVSKQKTKFTKEETEKITKMINEGYSTSEIIKEFGGTTSKSQPGKRIYDKITQIKKSQIKAQRLGKARQPY